MNFCEKLMELRKQKSWSQEELGNQIGVSRQTISKWEQGITVPEMNNLLELSRLFQISLDELAGNEGFAGPAKEPQVVEKIVYAGRPGHYEYKSRRSWRGLPLVHVNVGHGGLYRAKGVVAVGNIATGLVAAGAVSVGVVSVGAVSLGLLAIGCLALGLFSGGCIAAGLAAFGGIAVGVLSVGGVAVGIYSIGGVAMARDIAMGGVASGHIAIGDEVRGDLLFDLTVNYYDLYRPYIRETILKEFPDILPVIVRLFS